MDQEIFRMASLKLCMNPKATPFFEDKNNWHRYTENNIIIEKSVNRKENLVTDGLIRWKPNVGCPT